MKNKKNNIIAVQGALSSEIALLLDKAKVLAARKIGGFVFYECSYKEITLIVSKTKMGEIASAIATSLLISNYHPKLIINQGTAGALASFLKKGDIVIGERVRYISQYSTDAAREIDPLNPWKASGYISVDGDCISYAADEDTVNKVKQLNSVLDSCVYFGTVASGDIWTKDIETIKKYNAEFDVLCEAMECTGAYMAANSLGVPIITVRAISNSEYTGETYDESAGLSAERFSLKIIDELIEF